MYKIENNNNNNNIVNYTIPCIMKPKYQFLRDIFQSLPTYIVDYIYELSIGKIPKDDARYKMLLERQIISERHYDPRDEICGVYLPYGFRIAYGEHEIDGICYSFIRNSVYATESFYDKEEKRWIGRRCDRVYYYELT